MRFKLQSFASKKISCPRAFIKNSTWVFFWSFLGVIFYSLESTAQTRTIGAAGQIQALSGSNITTMAERSDGRYLFYSTGDTTFNVLDLEDMAWTGTAVTAAGTVLHLDYVSLNSIPTLIVTTTAGVQYYNVSLPFSIAQLSPVYTVTSGVTVSFGCADQSGTAYLFETGAALSNDLIQVVTTAGVAGGAVLYPAGLVSPNANPSGMRCGTSGGILFAESAVAPTYLYATSFTSTPSFGSVLELSSSLPTPANYAIQDWGLTYDFSQVYGLFNLASPTGTAATDSIVVSSSASSLASGTAVDIGSGSTAATSFNDPVSPGEGFFVNTDILGGSPFAANVFLFSSGVTPSSGGFTTIRGPGSLAIGSVIPSMTTSSASDFYKYMVTTTGQVTLLTSGPILSFADPTVATGQALTPTAPITFSVSSDETVNYDIRFDSAAPATGVSTGLVIAPGASLGTGTLTGGAAATPFSITAAQLGLTTTGSFSLIFTAWSGTQTATNPVSRLGIRFSYTPPPPGIQNFHLGFGDESVGVYGSFPTGTSLQTVNVYFSYDVADLSDANLGVQATTSITAADGSTLTSPLAIPAANWQGGGVIHPVTNGNPLFVRVQLIDTSNQLSVGDPPAQSQIPYPTLSLSDALGGTNTCSLSANIGTENTTVEFVLLAMGFALWIGLRRRNQ